MFLAIFELLCWFSTISNQIAGKVSKQRLFTKCVLNVCGTTCKPTSGRQLSDTLVSSRQTELCNAVLPAIMAYKALLISGSTRLWLCL